jgi:hypothetical protein
VLDHSLDNSASIVLVDQLLKLLRNRVFLPNCVDALLYENSLCLVRLFQLLLFHEQLVVIDSQLLDEIRHFGLCSSLLRMSFILDLP